MGRKNNNLIVIVAAIILVGGAIYYFGHMHLGEELDRLHAERTVELHEAERIEQAVDLINTLNQRIPVYELLINNIVREYTRRFYQAEYILYLESFLADSDIVLSTVTYMQSRAVPVITDRQDSYDSYEFTMAHEAMGYNSYRLQFEATNDQLLNFLRLIEASGKGFASSNAVVSTREGGRLLDVNLELRFFYLADMDDLTINFDFSEILENAIFLEERASIFQ